MARRGIPHRKNSPPPKRVPLEERTLAELDGIVARNSEPAAQMQKVKKVRRNKLGGIMRGEARSVASKARAAQIRAAAVELMASGATRFVPKLVETFGVSRSTVMLALRPLKVCYKPNAEAAPREDARPRKA